MMDYFIKLKKIGLLAAAGEPVLERDHSLQLLRGLGAEYNPIVASLTARETNLPLETVQSVLLINEQCLNSQLTAPEAEMFTANFASARHTKRSPSRNLSLPNITSLRPRILGIPGHRLTDTGLQHLVPPISIDPNANCVGNMVMWP